MLIMFLFFVADAYEAFWPDGAWGTWFLEEVFNNHVFENTEEPHDLSNHTLFFWTVAALRLPSVASGLVYSSP